MAKNLDKKTPGPTTPAPTAVDVEHVIARHQALFARETSAAWVALHAARVYAESLGRAEDAATLRALADKLAPLAGCPTAEEASTEREETVRRLVQEEGGS